MKQLKIVILVACILTGSFSPRMLVADCGSCSTTSHCCKKECIKFEKRHKAFCALLAQNLDACNAFLNSATFRNLHVLGDENIDGNLSVNDEVTILENLTINGELTIEGVPFSGEISQYAAFVRTTGQTITNDNTLDSIIAFDANQVTPTSGISNNNGIITFAETGLYLINFSTTTVFEDVNFPAFGLTNIPVTGTNITGTNFAIDSEGSNRVSGLVLLPITVPGQQIAVRNFSTTSINITNDGVDTGILVQPNVAAVITIIKIN